MRADEHLSGSRLFRSLRCRQHGQLVELYVARLVRDGLARQGTRRSLSLVGDLLREIASRHWKLTYLDERMVERYLQHRAGKQPIQPGDRAALGRLLSALREAGTIAPPLTVYDQIFEAFRHYLLNDRGLAPTSVVRHQPAIRQFLREVCLGGTDDLGRIRQEDVVHYIERHAQDGSPRSGQVMCWSLPAFLRYLTLRDCTHLLWPAASPPSGDGD